MAIFLIQFDSVIIVTLHSYNTFILRKASDLSVIKLVSRMLHFFEYQFLLDNSSEHKVSHKNALYLSLSVQKVWFHLGSINVFFRCHIVIGT